MGKIHELNQLLSGVHSQASREAVIVPWLRSKVEELTSIAKDMRGVVVDDALVRGLLGLDDGVEEKIGDPGCEYIIGTSRCGNRNNHLHLKCDEKPKGSGETVKFECGCGHRAEVEVKEGVFCNSICCFSCGRIMMRNWTPRPVEKELWEKFMPVLNKVAFGKGVLQHDAIALADIARKHFKQS